MSNISFVTQDNFLFDTSIKENIRMGNITATDEDVINAAKQAGCHEFIASLSEGYETAAGNAGNKLSGGQKQRIAIARAILRMRLLSFSMKRAPLWTRKMKIGFKNLLRR